MCVCDLCISTLFVIDYHKLKNYWSYKANLANDLDSQLVGAFSTSVRDTGGYREPCAFGDRSRQFQTG